MGGIEVTGRREGGCACEHGSAPAGQSDDRDCGAGSAEKAEESACACRQRPDAAEHSCGCEGPEVAEEGSCACRERPDAAERPCGCDGAEGSPAQEPACGCSGGGGCAAQAGQARAAHVRQGLRLEYFTVGWNVIEGLVSVAAALAAGSVALLGFGIDSFVETSSGLVLIWRLRAERRARDREEIERLDRRAHKLVGASLFLLAAYVAIDASHALYARERPEPTLIGVAITALSLAVMGWLARAKRRAARALESRALEADSFQTTACFWLSLITLVGIGLNAVAGWWWADPVAALGMTWFLVAEGREAWRGEDCGCAGGARHT